MLFVLKTTYLIMPACAEPCCADSPDSLTFAKQCCADSPNSPTFAEPCCTDSPDSPTFAKPCCVDSPNSRHSPSRFASTRQTRQHSPTAVFEKNVTRLATFARVIRHSREFGASGHCLVFPLERSSFGKISSLNENQN